MTEELLRAALKQIEYVQPIPASAPYCPACGNHRDRGHMASCLTGRALGTAPPIPEGHTVLIPSRPAPLTED